MARHRSSSRDPSRDPNRERNRERRRPTHHREDSNTDLLPPSTPYETPLSSPLASPPKRASHSREPASSRDRDRERRHRDRRTSSAKPLTKQYTSSEAPSGSGSKTTSSGLLSADALGRLNAANEAAGWAEFDRARPAEFVPPVVVSPGRRGRERRESRGRGESEEDEGEDEEEKRYRLYKERRRREREQGRKGRGDGDGGERERSRRKERERDDRDRRRTVDGAEERYGRRERSYDEDDRGKRGYRKEYQREEEYRLKEDTPKKHKVSRRVISGPLIEEGGGDLYDYNKEKLRGGDGSVSEGSSRYKFEWNKKRIFIYVAALVVILAIAIPVGIVVTKNHNASSGDGGGGSSSKPDNSELNNISENDIPSSAKGTVLDPFTWFDTTDFNVTYTDATVGGLPIMGLFTKYDDTTQANKNVPPLNQPFPYGKTPIRGMNVGGWLSLEPFITPSFFDAFSTRDGVIDEYTLTSKLGPTNSAQKLEKHYATFITESDIHQIQQAGFDHVRIPYSYWAVTTYPGDPFVPRISWRYLLRCIEWCRKYGLRVNLDLHGAPGSQNGWNHSGRQGPIGWLNGTDGTLNGQRTLDIHNQLSTFFAQPRYKNIVTMYGLVNEPRMVALDTDSVLQWTQNAISLIRKNNYTSVLVFGDGFMGLDKWQGKLQSDPLLLLDVHQYVIFNVDQMALKHTDKINFACKGWTAQALRSQNKATGFGPTLCGEWSQADTDCAHNLNNVGWGNRWEGTYNTGNASTAVLTPVCPTKNNPICTCAPANADPGTYSDAYKKWLRMFAEAQLKSFEEGWGSFYWTWQTESAVQWSWKKGMAAGILPKDVNQRDFDCSQSIPDFEGLGLPENY